MDFRFYEKVTVCLCVILQLTIGQECSNITFPDSLSISEATPAETVILEINITDSATDIWKLSPHDHFKFPYSSSIYKLSLATKIIVGCQKEQIFRLDFVCGTQKQSMNISVQYLDQFQPQWITSTVQNNLKVLESDLPGAVVLDLDGAVQDADCYKGGNHIEVVPYNAIPQLDASEYFAYNVTSKKVYLSRPFDYDKRYCEPVFKSQRGTNYLQLIVYSEDNRQNKSPLTRNVTFADVDDEPPIFLKSKDCDRCISLCKSTSQSHTIHLENDIQKNLTFDVLAKDFDTADAYLEYIIVGVNPEFLWRHIDIDADNGTVSFQLSTNILNSGNDTNTVDSINIFLQVRESHTNQTSDNMTLTFMILYPTLTTTMASTTAVTELTTTFDLATETTSDLKPNITETSTITDVDTTTEGSTTHEQRSTDEVTKLHTKTTTEIVIYLFKADPEYKDLATTLMIVLVAIGVIILLVITAYIIYKCRQQSDKRRSSYATRSSPFVTTP